MAAKKQKPKPTKPTPKKNLVAERIKKTKADLIIALEKSLGVVTSACKAVGIDRTIYYEYLQNDSAFAEKVAEIKNLALDFGESMLHQNMQKGDTASIIFFLKTQGKKRGYIEKSEVEHSGELKMEPRLIITLSNDGGDSNTN